MNLLLSGKLRPPHVLLSACNVALGLSGPEILRRRVTARVRDSGGAMHLLNRNTRPAALRAKLAGVGQAPKEEIVMQSTCGSSPKGLRG